MKDKIIKVMKFTIFNILFIVCGVNGLFYKIQWCENIFLFFIWLIFIISMIPLLDKKLKEAQRKEGLSVPLWLLLFKDILIVCMLAASGRFIAATAWFLHICFVINVHTTIPEEKNESKST
jgi:hypothetical protein